MSRKKPTPIMKGPEDDRRCKKMLGFSNGSRHSFEKLGSFPGFPSLSTVYYCAKCKQSFMVDHAATVANVKRARLVDHGLAEMLYNG